MSGSSGCLYEKETSYLEPSLVIRVRLYREARKREWQYCLKRRDGLHCRLMWVKLRVVGGKWRLVSGHELMVQGVRGKFLKELP